MWCSVVLGPQRRIMESWLTHTLTALAAFLGGSFLPFLLKWKVSTSGTYETMLTRLSLRLEQMEKRFEQVQINHMDCEKKHAKLEGKVEALERINNQRS